MGLPVTQEGSGLGKGVNSFISYSPTSEIKIPIMSLLLLAVPASGWHGTGFRKWNHWKGDQQWQMRLARWWGVWGCSLLQASQVLSMDTSHMLFLFSGCVLMWRKHMSTFWITCKIELFHLSQVSLCNYQFWYFCNLFIFYFWKFYLSNLYTHCGVWTRDPKMKSHLLTPSSGIWEGPTPTGFTLSCGLSPRHIY